MCLGETLAFRLCRMRWTTASRTTESIWAAHLCLDKYYAKPEKVAIAVLVMTSDVTAYTTGMGFKLDAIVPSH